MSSDGLVEAEWDSEYGSLETLEALLENSLGRKNWTFVLETLVLDRWMEARACLLHSFLGMETESGRGTGSGWKSAAFEVHSP